MSNRMMSNRVAKVWCGVVAWGLLCAPVTSWSQSPADDVDEMETLVVTATKIPIPLRQATSAVEVWTEEDLKKRNVKTVVQALRLSQGIAVSQSGGPGTLAGVRIRGGDVKHTLVLIDGAVANSATTGQFNFAHLTVDNIDTIEIVRGAQSTLWGSDAIGGVISITTKKGRGPLKAGAFFEYGSFVTGKAGGQMSGRQGPVDFSASVSRWDTNGISAIRARLGATERDAYENWQASARLGADLPDDGRFDLSFRWVNASAKIDGDSGVCYLRCDGPFGSRVSAPGAGDVRGAFNDSEQFIVSGVWRQPVREWWTHVLTLSRFQETSLFDNGVTAQPACRGLPGCPPNASDVSTSQFPIHQETRVLSNRLESQHNVRLNQDTILTMGYQFREQQGENDGGLSLQIHSSHSGFAQLHWNMAEQLFATAGVRHEGFNTFGDATTYRVTGGYVFEPLGAKIRGSYATGFRAPNLNELYSSVGNPDLRPEKSQSFDMGVDESFFEDRLRVSVGYFWNRYRNLINPFPVVNVAGPSTSRGWESSVDVELLRDRLWARRLALRGWYTSTQTHVGVTGARLAQRPVNQGGITLSYAPFHHMEMTVDVRFSGDQFNRPNNVGPIDGFTVVNVAATYDVTERLQAYLRIENLFDEEYEEVLFYGTPGASAFGGFRMNFETPVFVR